MPKSLIVISDMEIDNCGSKRHWSKRPMTLFFAPGSEVYEIILKTY